MLHKPNANFAKTHFTYFSREFVIHTDVYNSIKTSNASTAIQNLDSSYSKIHASFQIAFMQEKMDATFANKVEFGKTTNVCWNHKSIR
jgi:hypothetical protein